MFAHPASGIPRTAGKLFEFGKGVVAHLGDQRGLLSRHAQVQAAELGTGACDASVYHAGERLPFQKLAAVGVIGARGVRSGALESGLRKLGILRSRTGRSGPVYSTGYALEFISMNIYSFRRASRNR